MTTGNSISINKLKDYKYENMNMHVCVYMYEYVYEVMSGICCTWFKQKFSRKNLPKKKVFQTAIFWKIPKEAYFVLKYIGAVLFLKKITTSTFIYLKKKTQFLEMS